MLSFKPWAPIAVLRMLLWLFVCMSLGSLAVSVLGRGAGWGEMEESIPAMILGAVFFQAAILVLIHFFVREHGLSWDEAFGFSSPGRGQAVLVAVLAACIALPVAWILQMASVQLMGWFGIQAEAQPAVEALQKNPAWSDRLLLGATAVLLAPVAEELLFRGILYPTIKQAGYPRLALWGSAMLFALVHFNTATFLPLTFLAVVLTILYERTNNLLAPITLHALFNAANFSLLFFLEQPPARPVPLP